MDKSVLSKMLSQSIKYGHLKKDFVEECLGEKLVGETPTLIVKKPWGYEYFILTGQISLSVIHIGAGKETSLHYHAKKTAVFTLISGSAILLYADPHGTLREIFLQQGGFYPILHGIKHQEKALEDSILVSIESPGNIHDLIRDRDKYGRGQDYEVKSVISVDQIISKFILGSEE